MSEIVESVPLCPTCPARGLCIGDVMLEARDLNFRARQEESGATVEGFPGVRITASDKDGVTNTVATYTPEMTTSNQITKKGVSTAKVATKPEGGTRDDPIFNTLRANPGDMLARAAMRAYECSAPFDEQRKGMEGFTDHSNICRALSTPVLGALANQILPAE